MKIIGSEDLFYSEGFLPLTLRIIGRKGLGLVPRGNLLEAEIVNDHPLITITSVIAWINAGGTIEEFPCYIRMTDAAYAKDVPDGIPNRSYMDGETEVIRTWAQWHDANHEHRVIGGYTYVPSNCFGSDLTGAELALLYDLVGVTLLTAAEYREVLPNDDPQ